MTTPFVVVTLPAKDTVLGGLTQDTPVRIELVVHPRVDPDLGECYAFRLVGSGFSAADADDALQRLRQASVVIHSQQHEEEDWHADGWIPVGNIAQRSFRLLNRLPVNASPAWVVFQDGLAQARLCPSGPGPMQDFLHGLKFFLQQEGVQADVDMAQIDDRPYLRALEALGDLPEQALLLQ